MKHTSGRWEHNHGQVYAELSGKTLAVIPYYDNENSEQKGNAEIMAAAPDMIELCKAIDEWGLTLAPNRRPPFVRAATDILSRLNFDFLHY